MNEQFYNLVLVICKKDPRYKPAAYEFVMEALSFTQKRFRRLKHVSGRELLEGIKDLLLKQFGPMAMSVLDHWGVKTTEDFGNIVFNLVEYKLMTKDSEDHYDNFRNGYDFEEVFSRGYRQELAKRLKSMRF